MAKLHGPLFSLSAQGKFNSSLIFQKQRNRNVAKAYASLTDKKSASQLAQRARFSEVADFWAYDFPFEWMPICLYTCGVVALKGMQPQTRVFFGHPYYEAANTLIYWIAGVWHFYQTLPVNVEMYDQISASFTVPLSGWSRVAGHNPTPLFYIADHGSIKPAWNASAIDTNFNQTGWHLFSSCCLRAQKENKEASMITEIVGVRREEVVFSAYQINTRTAGIEAGDYVLEFRTSASDVPRFVKSTGTADFPAFDVSGWFAGGDTIKMVVYKENALGELVQRSGLFEQKVY